MIDARELRVGNWYDLVNPMAGGEKRREQFTSFGDAISFEHYGEPIALTPDILEKIEFTRIQVGWDCKQSVNFSLYQYKQSPIRPAWNDIICGRKIQYLHQLQNVFFCLCGEDLKIDL